LGNLNFFDCLAHFIPFGITIRNIKRNIKTTISRNFFIFVQCNRKCEVWFRLTGLAQSAYYTGAGIVQVHNYVVHMGCLGDSRGMPGG
jgi:hypothetical protein